MEKRPTIILTTGSPIVGYWDGGAKSRFEFTLDAVLKDDKGRFAKWGSWQANFWFTCGYGRSLKHAARIAATKLARLFRVRVPFKVEIVWR